jgi:acetyl esterase/lipase
VTSAFPRVACAIALCLVALGCGPPNVSPSGPPTLTPTQSAGTNPSPTATDSTPPTPTTSPTTTPPRLPEGELNIVKTVPYATTGDCGDRVTECQQFVDVYAPAAPGPWPVVVMVHGRPRTPADMVELAKAVARRGAVVFNADYRGVRPVEQQGWPEAIDDVACAVRFARATAADYGGNPSRLILVGHSFGGYVGTLVALAGDEFHGDCLVDDGSALPDAWVGISANCVVGVPPPPHPLWSTFYGGDPDERPAVWQQGDTLEHLGGNPDLIVRMVHMRDDPIVELVQPRTLVRQLKDDGYDATLTILDGSDHWGPLDLDRRAGGATLDVVLDAAGITD